MHDVSPDAVLTTLAQSLPPEKLASVIVVGSLAAAYAFFRESPEEQLRTKDADCMVYAPGRAVVVASDITEYLFDRKWTFRSEGEFSQPGSATTPEDQLPIVRLNPPDGSQWFLELLSVPSQDGGSVRAGRQFQRLETKSGHFALCAFGYFAVLEYGAIETPHGLRIASPAMMALCNLLHHPEIKPDVIRGSDYGVSVKRSNKDLGRVLALAYLTTLRDEDELEAWPAQWKAALETKFPDEAPALLRRAGAGLHALLNSDEDFEQAHMTAVTGLLSARKVKIEAFRAVGRRFVQDVLDPITDGRA